MRRELSVGGQMIPYEIVRSSRRTMAIQVTGEANVVVRVPNWALDPGVTTFLEHHAMWIYGHYISRKQANENRKELIWEDGAVLLYKGRERKLSVIPVSEAVKPTVCELGDVIRVTGTFDGSEQIKAVMIQWYKERAAEVFAWKVEQMAFSMNVSYEKVSVRSQKRRWGSCSAAGNISLNWKLVMIPEELMDYVIIHELVHRREMNHSPRFWNEVKQALPNYKVLRRRLRDYEDQIISGF